MQSEDRDDVIYMNDRKYKPEKLFDGEKLLIEITYYIPNKIKDVFAFSVKGWIASRDEFCEKLKAACDLALCYFDEFICCIGTTVFGFYCRRKR